MSARATFYYQSTPGGAYVRCHIPARYLPGKTSGPVPAYQEDADEHGPVLRFTEHEGVCVWQFPGLTKDAVLIAHMQEQGIRCYVEVDDNYLVLPGVKGLQSVWRLHHKTGDAALPACSIHRRICEWADGIIVSTPRLAGIYGDVNPKIHVCENLVDPDDWQHEKPPSDKLRVGIAGSSSHVRDWPLVDSALWWAAHQESVEIHILGMFGKDPKSFVDNKQKLGYPYVHYGWQGLEGYRRDLGNLDIGLAPIVPNPWSLGKSDLKVLEYAMAGCLPIVSDVAPYRPWRGILPMCKSAGDFTRHVQYYVNHPDEARELAAEVRRIVMETRNAKLGVPAWEEAVAA